MNTSKSLQLLILAGACLLLAIIILPVIFIQRTNSTIDDEIARIKTKGEPLTMADLAGPPIPDKDNGAVVYEKIFKLLKSPNLKKDVEAIEFFDIETKDPTKWSAIEPSLQKMQPIKKMIKEATSRPKCRFKINWQEGYFVELPYPSQTRQLARILRVDAVANARLYKMNEAVNSIKLGFLLENAWKEVPTLISHLVRTAILSIDIQALQDVMRIGTINEVQLKQLFDSLGKIDLKVGLKKAMLGERVLGLWGFQHTDQLFGSVLNSKQAKQCEKIYSQGQLLKIDEAAYVSIMRQSIDKADLTFREAKSKGKVTEIPRYAILTSIMLSDYESTILHRDITMAKLTLARVSLALQTYKSKFHSYPDSLNKLNAKLGWKFPEDPFSGKDLRYRREGQDYLLYSVGADMKDDHGLVNCRDGYDSNKPGDIVWNIKN